MPTRILDILVAPRAHVPDGPAYVSLRLSGAPEASPPLALQVSIPGPRREIVVRTWDDRDPLLGPIVRHRLGGMLGDAGNAYTARLHWSPAYEVTMADGGIVPLGTHVELFGHEVGTDDWGRRTAAVRSATSAAEGAGPPSR